MKLLTLSCSEERALRKSLFLLAITLNTFNSWDVDKFRLQKDNPFTEHGKTYIIVKGLTRIKTSEHFLKNNFIPVEIKQLITETIST